MRYIYQHLSGAKSATSREADARADMMIDATRNWEAPMTMDRLFSWHAALFPTGYSGLSKIAVGRFRDDRDGPMRVVSRHGMMERVHFVAPDAQLLDGEIKRLRAFGLSRVPLRPRSSRKAPRESPADRSL